MGRKYLDIELNRLHVAGHSGYDQCDEKVEEGFTLSLGGEIRMRRGNEAVYIQVYREREDFDNQFDEMGIESLDDHFFAEAPRASIQGSGEIFSREESRQCRTHLFAIVVSDEMYRYILKHANLAIIDGKGRLSCALEIPRRFWEEDWNPDPVRDTELPVVGYIFSYETALGGVTALDDLAGDLS